MTKTAELKFIQIEVNLLIRATDHLIDAYKGMESPACRATATNLTKIRGRLSKASTKLIMSQ